MKQRSPLGKTTKSQQIKFREMAGELLLAETLTLVCSADQQQEMAHLASWLQPGCIFNLLNASQNESGQWEAEFLILEPDYLVDISSLAECFRSYGNHPLNYTLSRLRSPQNTRHILLGNAANFFMDELVNEDINTPVDYLTVLKKLFQYSPFEFTSCDDLKDSDAEIAFFTDCKRHFDNIRHAITKLFPAQQIDRYKTVIEPSFISNALGLQGRLDLMLDDFSAFLELKSGKGIENFREGGAFMHSCANHYIQMILYLAVLQVNLDLESENVKSYLFYSKYPVLSLEGHSKIQLQKAISLRNSIVAVEYAIQKNNNTAYTTEVLGYVRSSVINTVQMTGNFFENYLKPSIDQFEIAFKRLNELEKTYFMRLYTFIAKELWLSKVGEREYEGVRRSANLWSASFQEKLEAGEVLYDLSILENQAGTDAHFLTLRIPELDEIYLPNFRNGDAVVLYERNTGEDCVNNKQIFRGSIESLNATQIKIRLRAKQRNHTVLKEVSNYALEHDYMDSTYTSMFRALTAFAEANQDRRDLLLGKRTPRFKTPDNETKQNNDIQRAVDKSLNAEDCLLLIGPPGTGKTSLALKQMVEAFLSENKGNILLTAYTNRAVDEICKALDSMDVPVNFIRIGSELNCAMEYRDKLLDKQLDKCSRRSEVDAIIAKCRIVTGTVASIWNKQELFKLKQFNLAIIDEATQLLEPHLLGILCAKTKEGKNAVERFVLIGDHKQLPAVILQSPEESKVIESALNDIGLTDLSNSLFERLCRKFQNSEASEAVETLSFQGRMHPEIAAFPSKHFYNGNLHCVGLRHQKEEWKKNHKEAFSIDELVACSRLALLPSSPNENNTAKTNIHEAEIVAELAKTLYLQYLQSNQEFSNQTLGIITPYRNQIALIRNKLHETGIKALKDVIVDTIERFQGSQKDVIIYSFCVNSRHQLNSLPCLMEDNGQIIDRKLNVVLTRARKQLFITGNIRLLSQNNLYKTLIEHVRENGIMFLPTPAYPV